MLVSNPSVSPVQLCFQDMQSPASSQQHQQERPAPGDTVSHVNAPQAPPPSVCVQHGSPGILGNPGVGRWHLLVQSSLAPPAVLRVESHVHSAHPVPPWATWSSFFSEWPPPLSLLHAFFQPWEPSNLTRVLPCRVSETACLSVWNRQATHPSPPAGGFPHAI